jgi:hypothetical protein
MLLRYFRNDFETLLAALNFIGITFVFAFHMRCVFVVRSIF